MKDATMPCLEPLLKRYYAIVKLCQLENTIRTVKQWKALHLIVSGKVTENAVSCSELIKLKTSSVTGLLEYN